MKVEGGTATSTLLHKPKVKEEAKEPCCCQEKSASTTTATMTTTTATTMSTSPTNVVTNAGSNDGTVSGVPVVPSTNVSSPGSSHQPSAIVCHSSAPTSTVLVNADPIPVDLDLKSKPKASREKLPREEAHSPSSRQKVPTKQSNGTRSSSDADSPLPPRSSKPEAEDGNRTVGANPAAIEPAAANCRTEEEQNDATSNRSDGDKNVSGNRCIAGVFAGHGELKSVLGTVVKFATGISPDTGDAVLSLVLALLSGGTTAEEFHSALQEATNYSLRGFVLPHLKQQLPSLQRDLSNAARANGQSCSQYLQSNEAAVLEAVGLSADQVEVFGEHTGNGIGNGGGGNQCSAHYGVRSNSNPGTGGIQHGNNATGGLHHYSSAGGSHAPKRRASDTPYYENGLHEDAPPVYGKRLNSWSRHHLQPQQPPPESSSPYCWYHPLHSSSGSIHGHGHRHNHGHGGGHGHGHGPNAMPPTSAQMSQMSAFSGSHHLGQQQQQQQQQHVQTRNGSLDDEWKNIHVMLNCILGMVEQTKTALAVLQTPGGFASPSSSATTVTDAVQNGTQANSNPSSSNVGPQVESSTGDIEGILKRFAREIVAQTIKAIEEKWAEMKRKDEESVKRAVIAEVQRAERVAVAESRVNERLRVHRLLDVPAPLSQRNHAGVRQGPYLRVHTASGQVDANARIVPTPSAVSNSIPSTSEDEKEPRLQSKCWNCGRPALETCGGCGIARYCGSFCQYRDWETGGHHASCGNSAPAREPRRSASRSPPRMASVNEANVAVPISASKPK